MEVFEFLNVATVIRGLQFFHASHIRQITLESGINVGQGINVGPGKFVRKNKHRAFNKRRA